MMSVDAFSQALTNPAKGKPMPVRTRTSSPSRKVPCFRAIGLGRATTQIGMANLVYNMGRFIWVEGKVMVQITE